jgi:predicted metalloprotease with PDZ domain
MGYNKVNRTFRFYLLLITIVTLLFEMHCLARGSSIYYNVSYTQNKDYPLSISVKFIGGSDGYTKLYKPIFLALDSDDPKEYLEFELNSDSTLVLEPSYTEDCSRNNKTIQCKVITIKHKPNAKISLKYKMLNSFNSFINGQNALFSGEAAFIFPDIKYDKIQIAATDPRVKHILKINSYSVNKGMNNLLNFTEENISKLLESWFFVGNSEYSVSKAKSYPFLDVITIGIEKNKQNEERMDHQEIASMAGKISSNNQKFIDYVTQRKNNKRKALVVINKEAGGTEFKGIAKTNFYIVNYSTEDAKYIIADTISHEMLHQLFGNSLSAEFGPEKDLPYSFRWFDEGFTCYYSSLLNLQYGVITLEEYSKIINDKLMHYYKYISPFQVAIVSYNRCRENNKLDFNNSYIEDLLLRYAGHFIAINIDNILKAKTHNKYSLKDILRSLYAECKNFPCKLSMQDFIDANNKIKFPAYNKGWFKYFLYNYIADFQTATLPTTILDRKLSLFHKKETNHIDFGLDPISFCTGITLGVSKEKNSYKTGARNGYKLSGISFGNALDELTLKVERNSSSIDNFTYKLINDRTKLNVPQYRLLDTN